MKEIRKGRQKPLKEFPVAMRLGETPVPIPNTMVKTQEADGTALETVWESRWLPDHKKEKRQIREGSFRKPGMKKPWREF